MVESKHRQGSQDFSGHAPSAEGARFNSLDEMEETMEIHRMVLRGLSKSTRMAPLQATLFIILGFTLAPQAQAVDAVVSVCDEAHFLAAVHSPPCAGCLGVVDRVTFSCSGVITLSAPVTIIDDQEIDGGGVVGFDNPGSSLSSGAFITRAGVFGRIITLTLANLTIQHVHGSAVVNTDQVLHVSNVKFILNDGSFPPYNLEGGAISNGGNLTVDDSYFYLNSASAGGGIYNTGSLTVRSSTFQFNNANADLSKHQLQAGGAIFNDGGRMIISNSTFFANGLTTGVGGNIYSRGDGVSEIRHSTLSNGRAAPGSAGNLYVGLSQSGALLVVNTIMANPEAGAGNCYGFFVDGGGNLQWPYSGLSCPGYLADPKLGPPAKNYGPTLTMALGPGSAAIDSGIDLFCTAEDQRHIFRPQGAHCDIGAYEAIPNTTGVVALLVSSIEQKFWSSLPKTGQNRLTGQVLAPLSRSLDPTLWQGDGNRLNPQRGEQVFDLHQTVVNNLSELIVDQTQLNYITNLVFADRTIATVAMGDGSCSVAGAPVSANSKCAQAAAELANGDTSSAAGRYGEAIAHYRAAWSDVAQTSHQ